jgi:hypothetical protein
MATLILSICRMKMFQEGDALKKLYLLKLLHLISFSPANTGRILLFVALPARKKPELNAIYGSFLLEKIWSYILKTDLWKKFLELEISVHGSYYNRPTAC